MTLEERQEKAREVAQSRILSQDEHKKMKLHQLAKEAGIRKDNSKAKKRKSTSTVNLDEERER